MTRFRLTVEFDGRPYMGWQRQAHGPSVQQAIEDAIEAVTGEQPCSTRRAAPMRAFMGWRCARMSMWKPRLIALPADGRHQRQAASAACCHPGLRRGGGGLARALFVPRAALCLSHRQSPRAARARSGAGLARHATARCRCDARAAQRLLGLHDFTTFRSAHCQAASPVKSLDELRVEQDGERIAVHAAARSFLHHQVRSMVGCLVWVGQGKWSADDLQAALEARNRAALGFNAPPDGLYFVEASYPG
jgi:tRNA pseudouridine38-40 synthase